MEACGGDLVGFGSLINIIMGSKLQAIFHSENCSGDDWSRRLSH